MRSLQSQGKPCVLRLCGLTGGFSSGEHDQQGTQPAMNFPHGCSGGSREKPPESNKLLEQRITLNVRYLN